MKLLVFTFRASTSKVLYLWGWSATWMSISPFIFRNRSPYWTLMSRSRVLVSCHNRNNIFVVRRRKIWILRDRSNNLISGLGKAYLKGVQHRLCISFVQVYCFGYPLSLRNEVKAQLPLQLTDFRIVTTAFRYWILDLYLRLHRESLRQRSQQDCYN